MKHKNILFTRRGGTEVIQIMENDLHVPTEGEARVRVLARLVCQDDVASWIGNRPFLKKSSFVPGYSFIGVVDAIGEGVTSVLVAYQILHRVAWVKAGDKILLIGASGGMGTAFLQLGRLIGLKMYGLASPSKHHILAEYGATPIDYHTQDFLEVLHEAEPEGIDYAFNGLVVDGAFGLMSRKSSSSFDQVTVRTNDPAFAQPGGVALQAAYAPFGTIGETSLTQQELEIVAKQALQRLEYSVDVDFAVADLPGLNLGEMRGDLVLIDPTAAGHGWNLEFATGQHNGSMDLLAVIMHELGHVLGLEHTEMVGERSDWMAPLLVPGIRFTMSEPQSDSQKQSYDENELQVVEPDRQWRKLLAYRRESPNTGQYKLAHWFPCRSQFLGIMAFVTSTYFSQGRSTLFPTCQAWALSVRGQED